MFASHQYHRLLTPNRTGLAGSWYRKSLKRSVTMQGRDLNPYARAPEEQLGEP
jgi:hypothetical protein